MCIRDRYKGDTDYIAYLEEKQKQQGDVINEFCWNEDRFIRGFTEAGETLSLIHILIENGALVDEKIK